MTCTAQLDGALVFLYYYDDLTATVHLNF